MSDETLKVGDRLWFWSDYGPVKAEVTGYSETWQKFVLADNPSRYYHVESVDIGRTAFRTREDCIDDRLKHLRENHERAAAEYRDALLKYGPRGGE